MLPLVFLPGMMCDARVFAPQIAALGKTRDVQTLAITAHDTVAGLASDVLQRAPQSFALAGLSMGGIVAMEVLRRAPDRVRKIALLSTNPLAEPPQIAARRIPQMEKAQAGQLADVMQHDMKPNYLAEGPGRAGLLDLCLEMALSLGADVFVRQSKALASRPDQTATLLRAQCPALILCGRHDVLCPVQRHDLMAELMPQSDMQIIETAGHLTPLEAPEQTTAALAHWLET